MRRLFALSVAFLLTFCQFSGAKVVKYGIRVPNGFFDVHDYVELGEVWAENDAAVAEFKSILDGLIIDFLFAEARLDGEEDVYVINAHVKTVLPISRSIKCYELGGEIVGLARFIGVMIDAYGKDLGAPAIKHRKTGTAPRLFRRHLKVLPLDTKVKLFYIEPVVDVDNLMLLREYSKDADRSIVNEDGYTLLTDGDSSDNNPKTNHFSDYCVIS